MKRLSIAILLLIGVTSIQAQNSHCSKIKTKTDKFSGSTTYSCPRWAGTQIKRMDRDSTTIYYLYLSTGAYSPHVLEKGVTVLFDDGTKIVTSDAVDLDVNTDPNGPPYIASSLVFLTEEEMLQLTEKKITDFRLYIYDARVTSSRAKKLMAYAECLLNK